MCFNRLIEFLSKYFSSSKLSYRHVLVDAVLSDYSENTTVFMKEYAAVYFEVNERLLIARDNHELFLIEFLLIARNALESIEIVIVNNTESEMYFLTR